MGTFGSKGFVKRSMRRYRERRALRQFLDALAYEVYLSQVKIDLSEVEAKLPQRRDGVSERLVHEVLERTRPRVEDLQGRIAGLAEAHGRELRALRDEVRNLSVKVQAASDRHRGSTRHSTGM